MARKKKASPPATPPTQAERKVIFLKSLEDNLGNVYRAGKACGISRKMYYDWRNADPEFAAQADETFEMVKDELEHNLVLAGLGQLETKVNFTAVLAFLNARGKDRGYYRGMEITGPGGGPIRHALEDLTDDQLRNIAGGSGRGAGA